MIITKVFRKRVKEKERLVSPQGEKTRKGEKKVKFRQPFERRKGCHPLDGDTLAYQDVFRQVHDR